MEIDEVIETSDAEEYQEEMKARERMMAIKKDIRDIAALNLDNELPPKKRTKYFHDPIDDEDIQTISPTKSESSSSNSPRRSPSFSTTFVPTSPGSLFTSRSPTRTPGHARILSITKSEDEETFLDMFTPPPEGSQDPLLLRSPTQTPLFTPTRQSVSFVESPHNPPSINTPETFTPINSPLGPRIRSSPLHLSPLSPTKSSRSPLGVRDNNLALTSPHNVIQESLNDRPIYTPTKSTDHSTNSSPLRLAIENSSSPTSIRIDRIPTRSPTPPISKSVSPEPTLQPPIERQIAQDDESVSLARSLEERSRYSLRTRKITQLRPFTTENLLYKQQMRAIPEAIVKNKALREHNNRRHPDDHYEDDGETQLDDGTQADDEPWEEMEQRRRRQRDVSELTNERQNHYPGILQGFQDDDEDEEIQKTAREAYAYKKQMEKEKKAKVLESNRREEESRRVKPFPLSKRDFNLPKPTKAVDVSDEEIEIPPRRSLSRPNSSQNMAALHDYFAQDDYEMSDPGEYNRDEVSDLRIFSSLPPHSILRNSYEDAIMVNPDEIEDKEMENEHANPRAQSITSDAEVVLDLEPKQKSALLRMMPAFMIKKMAKESAESKAAKERKRREEMSKNGDDRETLLPGQTRVQMSNNPKDIREIKGDSESEMEIVVSSDSDSSSDSLSSIGGAEISDGSDTESEANGILSVYQRPSRQNSPKADVIDLTNEHFYDSDAAPQASAHTRRYKPRRKGGSERLRDPSAIDYMLARSSKAERDGSSVYPRRKRSKFTHDIVTGGARKIGHGRQTVLPFTTDTKNVHRKSAKRQPRKQPRASGSSHSHGGEDLFDTWSSNGSDHETNRVIAVDKPTRRERKKMRAQRAKELGVYTFHADALGVTSGRRPGPVFITVDLEDESFHRSLLKASARPDEINWSKRYQPPLVVRKLKPLDNQPSTEVSSHSNSKRYKVENASDLGIPVLHPGKSFGLDSYIGKGSLYELVKASDDTHVTPVIPPTTLFGFNFDVDMGVEKLCSILQRFCEDIWEFATGLPDPDSDVTWMQWSSAMRMISQLTSFYYKNSGNEEATTLRNTVQTEASRLVNRIEQDSITYINLPILSVSWFLVEILTRIRHRPDLPSTGNLDKAFKYSSSLLMRLLLQYGLNNTMRPLIDDIELDDTSLAHYSAELWVCLIHVLGLSFSKTDKPPFHPFWKQLQDVLVACAETQNTRTPYEASEDAWLTIYSVCALSQFSLHGMTVGKPHLPACWDIVLFALRRIDLGKAPKNIDNPSERKYDNYLAIIVNRCFHLRDRYRWSLENSVNMFNELLPIFRSRKYSNLLHEKDEYPDFFRDTNWEHLSSHNSNEAAFTVFIKLIAQAAQEDKLHAAGQPSLKFDKLLKILVPMGEFAFSKYQGKEMAMFYNRMAALAIASDLDRSSLNDRIEKARKYVRFADVGTQLRLAVMRGMANWGCLLVQRKMNIAPFADWMDDITLSLSLEFKPESAVSKSTLELLLCFFFGAMRKIIQSCIQHSFYPEPSFLKSLKHINFQKVDFDARDGMVGKEFISLINAYLDARSKVLPTPPRPSLSAPLPTPVDEDNEESQDFGLADDLAFFDWTDADLPEALAAHPIPSTSPADTTAKNEEKFREVLQTFQSLKWAIFRGMKPFLEGSRKKTNLCDLWIRGWLGFSAIEAKTDSWSDALKHVDNALKTCEEEHWSRRVQLSIMFQTLQIDPKQYSDYMDRAFGVFLNTLVSDTNVLEAGKFTKPTLEREYVSLLLSIDGRHPLLLNAAVLPAKSEQSGDYELTAEQFLALRVPLLQGIFKNLNKIICEERAGMPEVPLKVQHYVTLCRDMFSAVRNNLSRIPKPSDKFTKYNNFCHETLDVLKGNRELCSMESMRFWATWRP